MKKQFILFILLMATIAFEASSFTIIISGGGKNHRYRYVIVTDKMVKCLDNGSNNCPINFEDHSLVPKTYDHLNLLVDFVKGEIAGGRNSGNALFNGWPISWKMNDDNQNIEINVDENRVEHPELYEGL